MYFQFASRVERMPRSGIREIFDRIQSYDDIADMSIGEPDFATPEPIATAVGDALGDVISDYTPTAGRIDLREKLSAKLAANNDIQATPDEEILVTPGAMGALYVATQVLCEPGDEVLVPEPHWSNYQGHIANTGASLVPVPTTQAGGFVPDPEDIRAAGTEDTVGLLLNTPGNPTGAVIDSDRLIAIGDVLAERDWWGIIDETYEALVYEHATHYSLARDPALFDRLVTIHSFSKSYAMTGWRLGYASGPADVISEMRGLQEHIASCAPEPSQVAAMAALDHPEIVDDLHEAFSRRRDLVLDRLTSVPGVDPGTPRGAFYVFADVSSITRDSRAFVEHLLANGQTAAVPGSVFGAAGEGFVRFSYATDEDTIRRAMDGVERAVQTW